MRNTHGRGALLNRNPQAPALTVTRVTVTLGKLNEVKLVWVQLSNSHLSGAGLEQAGVLCSSARTLRPIVLHTETG